MATQTVAASSARLQFPQRKAPATDSITQLELGLLISLRGRLKQIQDQVATAEESLKKRLAVGAVVEPGDHAAELKENFRRNVAWKAVVFCLALRLKMDGEAYCDRVLAATKPTKTVSLELH